MTVANRHVECLNYIPEGYKNKSKVFYFKPEYLSNIKSKTTSYCAIDNQQQQILSAIHFQIIDDQAESLRNAPFGGFDFFHEQNPETNKVLLKFILSDLRSKKVKYIIIKSAPFFYFKYDTISYENLHLSLNFKVVSKDINHHLDVSDLDLDQMMSRMEKRKLKKSIKSNFHFKKEEANQLKMVYQFVSNCRKERKQSISMSYQELKEAFFVSPSSYLLFTAYDNEVLIAASICVRVNKRILYHFYPASKQSYNTFSPMVFLISKIYAYCQNNNFEILDLGTSMIGAKQNKGLIQFKTRMGAISSQRSIFQLHYPDQSN